MAVRYALARKKAAELLDRNGVNAPPVPVERLARLCGADIRFEPFDGTLSGMVHRRADGSAVIGVNAIHANTRKRYTIAHEIGHLLLHDTDSTHIDEGTPIGFRNSLSSTALDEREIEANQFAASLLMPESFIRAELERTPFPYTIDDLISGLAERYQVSVQAMSIRLSRLGFVQ